MLKIYPTYRFYLVALGLGISLFFVELFPAIFTPLIFFALVFLGFIGLEIAQLFSQKKPFAISRLLRTNLSLGDNETIVYFLHNHLKVPCRISMYDNLPLALDRRDFKISNKFKSLEKKTIRYEIIANVRGEYIFDYIDIFIRLNFGFLERRFEQHLPFLAKVQPSVIQLKKYALANIKNSVLFYGVKKVRKIGQSYDFDHIKNYVLGDDVRSINWKATSRKNDLMVNHYEDEKSQAVYCIIDKSNVMNMPFNGLSLLDYAINASLVISNTALQHQDKAGLLTFSDTLGSVLPAANSKKQLSIINDHLYNQKNRTTESNYLLLYYALKKLTRKRSLFFLFTNFESMSSLEINLPIISKIAKQHVLVLIFFKNTEIEKYYSLENNSKAAIYEYAVAEKYLADKQKMLGLLKNYGIRCIYTDPKDLTINTLNEYISLKATGSI